MLTIVTGPLKVALNKRMFHLFDRRGWSRAGRRSWPRRRRACGWSTSTAPCSSMAGRPPESVRIEEQGPRKIVVRVEGVYTSAQDRPYMRYIARLVFRAGSPRVDVIYTHVNDYLQTEFTDVTSLDIPLVPAATAAQSAIALTGDDGRLAAHAGKRLSLFQTDEFQSKLRVDGRDVPGGRGPACCRQ